LFGHGLQPDADQIVALEVATGADSQEAARAVKLGRAFPQYARLLPRPDPHPVTAMPSIVTESVCRAVAASRLLTGTSSADVR
jgi:hypothetical protein